MDDIVIQASSSCSRGGYEGWRDGIQWSGSGDADDDDNDDGIDNETAYFLGLNPTGDVSMARRLRLPALVADGTNGMTYGFTRSTETVVAARHRISTSTNLENATWQPVLPTPLAATNGRVEMDVPVDAGVRRFYRLEIAE